MDFHDLATRSGEWLRGNGPESDIVISSRLRLARNLADFPFCNRASDLEKREIEATFRTVSDDLEFGEDLHYLDVDKLDSIDRQFLVERQLISRELATTDGARGVAIALSEDVSLMVNEEDHLRIQVLRSGYSLQACWELGNRIDDLVEDKVRYAFSEEFGYLTACPTNVGTGMRASVMLHLPALAMTKQIDRVFRALQKIQLAVRGLYGEGSQASGDFYQISNNVTLGKTEAEILRNIEVVVPQIVQYERTARTELVKESKQTLHDRVSRAYGILCTAQTISSEETMHLLSSVRMGVNLNLIPDVNVGMINDLFIHTQPAHLQKIEGQPLESEERNIARATYLRRRLTNTSESAN
ncbi:Protein arginine kinase [Planctomycetes bacterium Pan216]|uniref:Protein-arginine kinase n=1 Tax=Kolteria novifilia TaxID=2527975 RepID=A0A518B2Z6_9BACT|nr:Protein arginine kinase [Planctomycetes bacterium Pan216]